MELLGIDIGGSGVKGARVDSAAGTMLTERHRIKTPQPATPGAVAAVVALNRQTPFYSWELKQWQLFIKF